MHICSKYTHIYIEGVNSQGQGLSLQSRHMRRWVGEMLLVLLLELFCGLYQGLCCECDEGNPLVMDSLGKASFHILRSIVDQLVEPVTEAFKRKWQSYTAKWPGWWL